MAIINKDELLKDVRKIINESIQEKPSTYDVTKKFNIHRYITGLIEEGHKNPELMNMLVNYDKVLTNGTKDFMIFEQFGNDLAKYASGNKSVKSVIKQMNETLKENGMPLVGYQLIETISDPYTKQTVEDAFTNYVTDQCPDTLNCFIDSLDLVYAIDEPLAMKLNLLITKDSSMSDKFIHTEYVDDNQHEELVQRLAEEREKRRADEIYQKVEKYLADTLEKHEQECQDEEDTLCLDYIANNQGINLGEHLSNIANSDARSNERLMQVVEAYRNAVNMGAYEERLYETFIQNVSKFNYLLPVDKAIKSINEKVKDKYEEITLTKILEEMKDNQYSYIYVDLIQEDVARYVNEPTPTNRVQLRNALAPHVADPFINEMFKVLYSDNKRSKELSESALNIKDQINLIRENATVEAIYTPVQYIKENECIFNVNGQYYIKKGNNIGILEDKYVDQLDERFIELCHLVNDPHVEINEDYIDVYGANNMHARVFEGYVDVLNIRESKESLRDLRTMCMKHDNYDTNFYIMCSCLLENFNNIAKIDWAKHITLNENNNINADLFKLDNNIFVATHNDTLGTHTFYRNVNPIFCRNKINEHMGINVSALFSDLLPNQERIILKLNETKQSYEDSIKQYEDMIEKLKDAESTASEENKEDIQKAIKDAESKLDEIKAEYKQWQEDTAKATGEAEDAADEITDDVESDDNSENTEEENDSDDEEKEDDVITEPSNEPVSDKEVEDNYDELTTPLDTESNTTDETIEDDGTVTDDEFDNFLDMDDDETEISDDDEETEIEVDSEDNEMDDYASDENSEDADDFEEDIEDQEAFTEVDLGDEDEDTDDIVDVTAEVTDNGEDSYNDSEEDFDVNIDSMDDMSDDMSEDSEEEYDGHEATDAFGADVNDPLDTQSVPEELPDNVPGTEDETTDVTPKFSYKIANVMFDENFKTGTTDKSGSVIAIIPMVDTEGKSYVDNKTIKFYIDDSSNVILDNEEMTGDLYNAVINSIKSHPAFQSVCQNGNAVTIPNPADKNVAVVPEAHAEDAGSDLSWEEEYLRDGNDEDRGNYGLNAEDDDEWDYLDTVINSYNELGNSEETPDVETEEITVETPDVTAEEFSMDDTEEDAESEDIVIPMYKDGDTEVELPAANVDDTLIPESVKTDKKKALKESIKISAVLRKNGVEKVFKR